MKETSLGTVFFQKRDRRKAKRLSEEMFKYGFNTIPDVWIKIDDARRPPKLQNCCLQYIMEKIALSFMNQMVSIEVLQSIRKHW